MRFAELFAGAGGLSLGLERAGWECAWHAELADAPRAILSHRWPSVPLLGDVTTLDGGALTALHGPIDLLSGGSPCQDLSVAGKRAGMTEGSGTRSSLFFEQMRLWKETGADLCLWENVDGARSSNDGKDFGEVLRAFVGAAIAVPSDGWRSAGVAAGPLGVAAWRVLDAQYFGVPQRRRRIFVLGTRTGRVDPAEVLSLTESVRGDSPSSRATGEGFAGRADEGADGEGGIAFEPRYFTREGPNGGAPSPVVNALRSATNGGDSTPHVPRPSTLNVRHERTDPLRATTVPAVLAVDLAQITNKDNRSQPQPQPLSPTLNGHGEVIAFGQKNSAAQGASASASASAKCTPTLDKSKVPAVVCVTGETTHALMSDGSDGSEDGTGRGTPIVARMVAFGEYVEDGTVSTIKARDARDATDLVVGTLTSRTSRTSRSIGAQDAALGHQRVTEGIPRRLTPRECERLQAWPDDHTLVPDAKGKLLSDAARYKAIGNGVASVHSHWIGWRLALALHPASSPKERSAEQRFSVVGGSEGGDR